MIDNLTSRKKYPYKYKKKRGKICIEKLILPVVKRKKKDFVRFYKNQSK